MFHKTLIQVSVLLLVIAAFLAVPNNAQAGGVCGGTFTVEKGETLDSIAAMCGTTVSAITAANPGLSGALSVGQVITVPGSNYVAPSTTPVSTTATPSGTTIINNYYTTNNYYGYSQGSSTSSSGTYTVQPGDTFAAIASRFGLSIDALKAANPGIQDINLLYVGQVLNITGGITIEPVPTKELVPLSWGSVPRGTPYGSVRLSNKSKTEVYVSLQGETNDGFNVIREYPVKGTMSVRVPEGWYIYVAWVGGEKLEGHFNLGVFSPVTLTFNKGKVVVE